jgi:hypothetical protein
MTGSFCSIAFASTVPVVRPSSLAMVVIGLVPASSLSRLRSSSLHDCFQRAICPVQLRKPPRPTHILVEHLSKYIPYRCAASRARVGRRCSTFWPGPHGSPWPRTKSDCLIVRPRLARDSPSLPALCCLSGKTPSRQVNPRPRKYSALPKFGFGVSVRHLIPVRGAYRDRHDTRGELRWAQAASARQAFAGRATVSDRSSRKRPVRSAYGKTVSSWRPGSVRQVLR